MYGQERYEAYKAQRSGGELTPRQNRRLDKKLRHNQAKFIAKKALDNPDAVA